MIVGIRFKWPWDSGVLKPIGYLIADMFTPADCIAIGDWRKERDGKKADTHNAPLLTGFKELFITEGSTDMELSSIVSLILWETEEFSFEGRELEILEIVKLPVLS